MQGPSCLHANLILCSSWIFCVNFDIKNISLKQCLLWGAWMAPLVEHLTLAQVMISWFVGSNCRSGSVLTVQNLEPVTDAVSLSFSAPPPLGLCLSLKCK